MIVATDQGQKEKWGGSNAAEELGILVFQDKKKNVLEIGCRTT